MVRCIFVISRFLCLYLITSLYIFFFFLMIRQPPRSTLFPYTTLFRSIGPGDLFDVDGLLDPLALLEIADLARPELQDRKSTRLNSSHRTISYAVFCLKKKKKNNNNKPHKKTNQSKPA